MNSQPAWGLRAALVTDGTESDLYSCNCHFDRHGDPRVTFVARKIRQWPPGTGTSSLGEEVRNDVVLEATLGLFRSVGYRRLGYLEMMRDPLTGEHRIIEANVGRPTGRSAIAEQGGVELLYAAYADALSWPLPAAIEQRYRGAKWIYWRHDLQAAAYRWRRGELSLAGWWRSVRGPKLEAVGSWRDPAPFVADLARAARNGMALVARRLAGWASPRGPAISPEPRPATSTSRPR